MPLFDVYIMVDWSGARQAVQGANSIWIGIAFRTGGTLALEVLENPATRQQAQILIENRLTEFLAADKRVLIGFDFPYGYPRGLAQALGLPGPALPWARVWHHIATTVVDTATNASNHFQVAASMNVIMGVPPGPFWGYVKNGTPLPENLTCKRPASWVNLDGARTCTLLPKLVLPELRHPEALFQVNGWGYPQPTWKLAYPGSVGSQVLTGIPRVYALRYAPAFDQHSEVWPFETDFTATPGAGRTPYIMHAEIYPSAVPTDMTLHNVKDAAQVLTLARHFATLDINGQLGAALCAPAGLSPSQIRDCIEQEGCILK